MIAVDTNILVYAHRRDSPWHDKAKEVVKTLAEGTQPWAIPWTCIHEFYGVVTHSRIYSPPSTREQAFDQLEAWFASPTLVRIGESSTYWPVLRAALDGAKAAGAIVHDGRISAVCELHGISELWTADRDFSRFKTLRTKNPLV